jgi:hypothetical protein
VSGKKWDLSQSAEVQGAAGWIRSASGAALVLVIRDRDVACSIDPKLQPMDAITVIRDELPSLLQYLITRRAQKIAKAKQKHPVNPDAEDPE